MAEIDGGRLFAKALKQEPKATAELDRLRTELESLRKRNRDLEERLGKLEAK